MISYILPTRDRPEALQRTLAALGRLSHDASDAEVIVADNASDPPARVPRRLDNGVGVEVVRHDANAGASARNAAAEVARGAWLVMLDDDSHPLDAGLLDALADASPGTAAVGAEITLPDGSREAGGLPEVFVGCGAAIRRAAFLEAGGYDPSFGFYAEEYDLCARLLAEGRRVVHDARFRVRHEKTRDGRDMSLIVRRLVRNNGWVFLRYAPEDRRDEHLHETIVRYGSIAERESAVDGYLEGLAELFDTWHEQTRRSLPAEAFDRFTGLAHARDGLRSSSRIACAIERGSPVAVVDQGKNAWAVRRVLAELGCPIAEDARAAETLVIGTLSPGPMLDARDRRRATDPRPVVTPWRWSGGPVAGRRLVRS